MAESKKNGSPIEQFKNKNKGSKKEKAALVDKKKVPIKKNFVAEKESGGKVDASKVSPNDTIHVGNKPYSLTDKVKQYPKVDYKKLSNVKKA
jgi:hypothetical protein